MSKKINFTYSQNGLALTQKFQGLRSTPYQDQVGVWTIGYGHRGKDVHPQLTITQEQANNLLMRTLLRLLRLSIASSPSLSSRLASSPELFHKCENYCFGNL